MRCGIRNGDAAHLIERVLSNVMLLNDLLGFIPVLHDWSAYQDVLLLSCLGPACLYPSCPSVGLTGRLDELARDNCTTCASGTTTRK